MGDEADHADDSSDYEDDENIIEMERKDREEARKHKAIYARIRASKENIQKSQRKTRIECGWRDPKYDEIEHDSSTRAGRSHFCNERDKIHKERERNFQKDRIEAMKTMTNTQVFVKCKRCKGGFVARKVDVKRGWGKFCSKSCKAQHHNNKNFGTLKER